MKLGKKLLAVALAAVLALSMLTACGGNGDALVQPDLVKGKEVCDALNDAREKNAEGSSVEWDAEMAAKGTAYANAYADYRSAAIYYYAHKDDAAAVKKVENAQKALSAAESAWRRSLPDGYIVWGYASEDSYDNYKADGKAYFEEMQIEGEKLNVVTSKGERAAVTVVRKNDVKVMLVVVWRAQR